MNYYKKIRKESPIGEWYNVEFIAFFVSRRISPFFTNIFLKRKTLPNTITVYMILSGWIGAILFMFDSMLVKIMGYALIHLWFIMDCSDGEVARITKNKSTMGRELDYLAHIVNHPMFAIAFAISMLQMPIKALDNIWIVVIFSLLIILNLVARGLMSLNLIYEIKSKVSIISSDKLSIRKIAGYGLSFFCVFPNIATIFPVLYFVDMEFNTFFAFYYICISVITTIIFVLRLTFLSIKKFHAA
jgi:phosphatidylserine synthase